MSTCWALTWDRVFPWSIFFNCCHLFWHFRSKIFVIQYQLSKFSRSISPQTAQCVTSGSVRFWLLKSVWVINKIFEYECVCVCVCVSLTEGRWVKLCVRESACVSVCVYVCVCVCVCECMWEWEWEWECVCVWMAKFCVSVNTSSHQNISHQVLITSGTDRYAGPKRHLTHKTKAPQNSSLRNQISYLFLSRIFSNTHLFHQFHLMVRTKSKNPSLRVRSGREVLSCFLI